jgi:hypothetical protein
MTTQNDVFAAWRQAVALGSRGRAMRHVRAWEPFPALTLHGQWLAQRVLDEWFVLPQVERYVRRQRRCQLQAELRLIRRWQLWWWWWAYQ